MKAENYADIVTEVDKEQAEPFVPMAPEIVQTSSFYFATYEQFMADSADEKNHFIYTRGSNPTIRSLEDKLAWLEGGEKCKVFASGMGAISSTLFTLLRAGDHILMVNTIYGEAVSFAKYLAKFGVVLDKIDVGNTDEIEAHITEQTKMIYFESPSSQKFEMLDLEKIAAMAKTKKIYTVIDGTWASPLFQHPLDHGIDIVIHSLSKYIGGHSDLVGGAVIGKTNLVDNIFANGHQALGAVISPFDAWLAIRGIRTLPVRMAYVDKAIRTVLDQLKNDPRIAKIDHPYCGDAEQQRLASKYLSGYGSLFGMDMADEDFDKLKVFVDSLRVVSIGVSWGGFESLALPSYKGNNKENLVARGLPISHIRMYVGLEDPQTIVTDIQQAMDKAYGKI
ncbi:MAG: aminotransferase class I/II-fold pyridoxal phosphate-dependent enzyme [Schleiferilactobacillus harbinensis]|jgi:cystathionine beta-lyase/cystathionine gamma-synthase|nr:aminotransferase class I/II-fold pyridoxal phosphate-dependent enzyme [Schleiferilactobacillus harbinensis]MCI1913716.1 aminotransferase class I/II-fold pyridoxal phosphate-dependent enzyme [Schleiferilactobacillus harbinensis]